MNSPDTQVTTLAEWKLVPPRLRPGVVSRPRLFAVLDRRAETALTLITAPAGSGKTELVVSWLETHPEVAVAWLSLDARDSDPLRFWTHVAHSVDRVRAGMARPALSRLRTPGVTAEEAVDELMNGIATFAGRLLIVLDDLHHFANGSEATSLTYAADHLPGQARIIATTRADPVVRLGRLRARGAVADLRSDQLVFTVAEAKELIVDQMGVDLGRDELATLVERTEGWPAGISLAGIWLSEVEDPSVEVRGFSGDHRPVVDYLTDEVLDAVDDATRDFMVQTSVLDRLCGPLCDVVLETTGSGERLEALSHSNLFLIPLDRRGEWYRYHQLFRDLLALELSRRGADTIAQLHLRAAEWFVKQGLVDEALEQTAAAGDPRGVAELLSKTHVELVRSGRVRMFARWLDWLPDAQLREHPELASAGALACAPLGRPADERARLLRLAESSARDREPALQRWVEAVSWLARSATIDCDLAEAASNAHRAVDAARAQGDELVVPALAALAYILYLRGDLTGTAEAVEEALARPEAPQRPHGLIYATACGALVDCDLGRPRLGEIKARRALDTAGRVGLAATWSASLARVALGHVLLETDRAADAERQLERAEIMRRSAQPTLEHAHALLLLARARVVRGRLPLAAAELDAALERLEQFEDAGMLGRLAEQVEDELAEALQGSTRPVEPPTPAELLVLRLLATDLSQREIAKRLFLSFNTVKTHSRSLYRKLGANNREDAVRRATEVGLIETADSPGQTSAACSPG
jgi:LuxR family maltose regulon positive regulatory protein